MVESVILSTPVLLLCFGTALFLCLFDKKYRDTCGWFSTGSAVVTVTSCAYALVLGAAVWEVVAVLLIFLLLNLEGFT